MWAAGLMLGVNLSAVDRLPQLTLNSYSQPLGIAMAGSEKDLFSTTSAQFIAAQEVEQYIEILLSVRHNPERLKLAARYAQFVQQATHTVLNTIIDTTFDILDSMMRADRYWQYQHAHQAYYYFHKHPAKWFDKELQQSEIHKHREQLSSLQKIYFAHVGTATQQLKLLSVASAASPTTIAHALQQMAYIVGLSRSEGAEVGTSDQHVELLAAICNQISLYADRAARALRPNTIPAPLHRYGLSAIAGAIGLMGYLKLRHDLHARIDALHHTSIIRVNLTADKARHKMLAVATNAMAIFGDINLLLSNLISGISSAADSMLSICDKFRMFFHHDEGAIGKIGAVFGIASGLVTGPSLGMAAGYASDTVSDITKTVETFDEDTASVRDQLKTMRMEIPTMAIKALDIMNKSKNYTNIAAGYGALASKAAVTVGIPLAGWAVYKLTKSVYSTVHSVLYPTSDYYYTRQSMLDIAHILNNQTNVNALQADQLGALVYHMHIISEISVADEYAEQFAQDISELAGEGYDVMQKLRIIDRMYRTYPFLNVAAC